eukprot:12418806-Karenia_brevis.AAC.1
MSYDIGTDIFPSILDKVPMKYDDGTDTLQPQPDASTMCTTSVATFGTSVTDLHRHLATSVPTFSMAH